MTDQAPELLPRQIADEMDRLQKIADATPDGTPDGYSETQADFDDYVQANLPAILAALRNTRPTPAERPVPQVREALEQIIETDDLGHCATLARDALAALTARPSDAAVAWREALKQIRHYCDENLGPSRSSLLNKIAKLADDALALSPDEPARVTDKGK